MSKIKGKQIQLDTSPNLGMSDIIISSQRAIKQYVDNQVLGNNYVETIIGDDVTTTFQITHNFNSYDVIVQVFENSGNRSNVEVGIDRNSTNQISIIFNIAPTSSEEFRVLVTKIVT